MKNYLTPVLLALLFAVAGTLRADEENSQPINVETAAPEANSPTGTLSCPPSDLCGQPCHHGNHPGFHKGRHHGHHQPCPFAGKKVSVKCRCGLPRHHGNHPGVHKGCR